MTVMLVSLFKMKKNNLSQLNAFLLQIISEYQDSDTELWCNTPTNFCTIIKLLSTHYVCLLKD